MDIKRFPEKMGDLPIDFSNPKRTLISGLFQETAKVGGQPRKFLTYIPEGLDYCQPVWSLRSLPVRSRKSIWKLPV